MSSKGDWRLLVRCKKCGAADISLRDEHQGHWIDHPCWQCGERGSYTEGVERMVYPQTWFLPWTWFYRPYWEAKA